MRKNTGTYVLIFLFILILSSFLDGFATPSFFKAALYAAIIIGALAFYFNYTTMEKQKELEKLVESERSNLGIKGMLSDDNPFKSMFQPIIDNFFKLKSLDKRLRDSANSIFQKKTDIMTANASEDEIIKGIAGKIETINITFREFTEKIELLSASIEESSSSTLELGASIEEVSENISKLFHYVDDTSTAIFELTTISREITQNLDTLKKFSEDTNSAMLEMEASIKEVEVKALETARFTEEMEKDAQIGKEAINATENSMQGIRNSSSFTYNALNELSGDIKSIGKILKVIEDIAEETALLALNAAIIAAQSGEQGKSFSVVAEEIKELAERTGVSTKEIATIIQNILVKSDKAGNAIGQSNKTIQEGAELTAQTGEIFKKILNSIGMADDRVREIAKANTEQSKGITHITKSTEQINIMVTDFSKSMQEQRRGAEQITMATEKVKDIANFAKNSTAEQANTSKQIGKAVIEINEMGKYFRSQIIKFRDDFEDVSKSIMILKPSIMKINNAVSDLALTIKNVESELESLTALRKLQSDESSSSPSSL